MLPVLKSFRTDPKTQLFPSLPVHTKVVAWLVLPSAKQSMFPSTQKAGKYLSSCLCYPIIQLTEHQSVQEIRACTFCSFKYTCIKTLIKAPGLLLQARSQVLTKFSSIFCFVQLCVLTAHTSDTAII